MTKARNAVGLVMAALFVVALAGPAGAARTLEGDGIVVAKDLALSRVTVDDRVFVVDARTVIEDLNGMRIPLDRVPLRSDAPNSMNQSEPGAVAYRAVRTSQGWVLLELTLIEAQPR